MIFLIAIVIVSMILLPDAAYAWGPGMHIDMAMRILADPSGVLPAISKLITSFPADFIYGATSPDIIVGKKYAGYHYHCHNWRMGHLILAESKSDRQRAASYGYLMHLAMDVVAHNYYVPFKYVRHYSTRLFSHTYWEMRFDLGVPDRAWNYLGNISRHEIEEFDELLERVLRKTLFSFRTNKRIFNSILILQKMRGMREVLRFYASKSRWGIEDENRAQYIDLTWESARDFLANPETAQCLTADPAGLQRLDYAIKLRRRLRGMVRKHVMTVTQAEKLVVMVREHLAHGVYQPEMVMPDVEDVL
ncbi:MAG: zinc dependent phospholipase C family protein [Deltaproteobacteria bacterium]|nr:zinc dependent phospholipase C family protein [Deltaproteobacteria bacterium]